MKKTLITPRVEVIHLQAADIIVTSPQPQSFQLIEDEQKAVTNQNMIW